MATKKKATTSGQRLNRELLQRAREQAREIEAEAEEEAVEEGDFSIEIAESAAPVADSPRRESARPTGSASRRASTAKRLRDKNEESRRKSMTGEQISEILANPTKFVSEAELREQYGFVLRDLRSMALLAGASFFVLVVLAVALPT